MIDPNVLKKERLALLQTELSILSAKTEGVVATLWRVRTTSLTLWTASVAVGLGSLDANNDPNLYFLVLTAVFPALFLFVDAKNHQWYRRVTRREKEIQAFINNPEYKLPSTQQHMTFDVWLSSKDICFPVYDLPGKFTCGKDVEFAWDVGLLSNLTEPIPLLVYGTQMFLSCVACTLVASAPVSFLFIPLFMLAGGSLIGFSVYNCPPPKRLPLINRDG